YTRSTYGGVGGGGREPFSYPDHECVRYVNLLSRRTYCWPNRRNTHTKMIVIQQRIEQQKITPLRSIAPNRIIREQQHVPLAPRHIYHRRPIGQFAPSRQHSGNQQILLVGKTQHHSWPRFGPRQKPAQSFALLIVQRG